MNPSIGAGITWTARLIENQFGDGYRQTGPDGLNSLVGSMTLSWEMLSVDQKNSIDGFLRSNVARPFYYNLPYCPIYLWDCKTWAVDSASGITFKITATFNQRFDLG